MRIKKEEEEMVSLLKSKKIIYDTWIENCTISTNGNGRNIVQISNRKYIEKHGSLSH